MAPHQWQSDEEPDSKTSGKAIASLVCGIFSFFCTFLSGIPALILGIIGLTEISNSRGRLTGKGMAISGIVTGSLGTLLSCVWVLILPALLLPAVQKVREAANRAKGQDNLKQVAIAMLNYESTYGTFPPAAFYSKEGKPLYSWRVAVLPMMGKQALYQQFNLDEPWDSPKNIKLLPQMPSEYTDPGFEPPNTGETLFQVFVGQGAAFEGDKGIKVSDFKDGVSKTVLVVEAATSVPWTRPQDLTFERDKPLPTLGGHHFNVYNAAFADGSVHALQNSLEEKTLRALITRNGGETVSVPAP